MTRSRLRLTSVMAVLLTMALVLAGCGNDDKDKSGSGDNGGAKTTVTLAFVGALTGEAANLGINIRDGAKTAIDEYNKTSKKYNVVLKSFDTAGDPAQASTVKDQFINDTSIIGIIGPGFSGETKALLPAFQEAGLVMISSSATNKDLPTVVPNSTVFHRAIADDTFQGKGIGEYIVDNLKGKTIVVIDDNSDYGKGLADDTAKAIGEKGGSVAKRVKLDPKAADFSAAVNDAKAANPDVIMYGGYYQEAGRLRKQLVDAGVKATFISGDGALDPAFVTAAGAGAAEGALLSCPCNLANDASSGKLGDFFKSYKADIGKDPGTYSPESYDVAKIYLKGIDAGNTTREKMLNFVEKDLGSYEGISKTIEFQDNGNIKTPNLFVFEVKGGKIVSKSS